MKVPNLRSVRISSEEVDQLIARGRGDADAAPAPGIGPARIPLERQKRNPIAKAAGFRTYS